MSKQLLPHDVTTEDRMRGCIWASIFRRSGDEVQKLGVLNGDPIIDYGVTLDGVNDFIIYSLWRQFTEHDPWSFHCIFYPDFNWDEDFDREIFDTNGNNYRILKGNAAGSNVLRIDIGGSTIADVASATYSGLWAQNGRNLLTVASTSGATDAWFNGTQILTADVTAWTPVDVTSLGIGGSAGSFAGRIEMFKVYGTYLLTEEDHDAVWAGGGA